MIPSALPTVTLTRLRLSWARSFELLCSVGQVRTFSTMDLPRLATCGNWQEQDHLKSRNPGAAEHRAPAVPGGQSDLYFKPDCDRLGERVGVSAEEVQVARAGGEGLRLRGDRPFAICPSRTTTTFVILGRRTRRCCRRRRPSGRERRAPGAADGRRGRSCQIFSPSVPAAARPTRTEAGFRCLPRLMFRDFATHF
jgi:hypothetical protein